MGVTNIMKKIKSHNLILNKIEAINLFDQTANTSEIERDFSFNFSILDNNQDTLKLKYSCNVFFNPKVLFEIKIEYIAEYNLKEAVTEDEITKDIEFLASPIGNELSYTVAFISDKMLDQPIIIPPTIDKDEINMINTQ